MVIGIRVRQNHDFNSRSTIEEQIRLERISYNLRRRAIYQFVVIRNKRGDVAERIASTINQDFYTFGRGNERAVAHTNVYKLHVQFAVTGIIAIAWNDLPIGKIDQLLPVCLKRLDTGSHAIDHGLQFVGGLGRRERVECPAQSLQIFLNVEHPRIGKGDIAFQRIDAFGQRRIGGFVFKVKHGIQLISVINGAIRFPPFGHKRAVFNWFSNKCVLRTGTSAGQKGNNKRGWGVVLGSNERLNVMAF